MMFLALCAPGLENIVVEEIESIGIIKEKKIYAGLIVFDFIGDNKPLSNIKTADDVQFLVKKFSDIDRYKSSLWKIKRQLKSVNLMKILFLARKIRKTSKSPSFYVKASYIGRRDYTAKDIAAALKRAIKGKNGWVFKEKSELHFHAVIRKDISVLGMSLGEMPLHVERQYITIPGSLKASVANAMLRLAQINRGEIVLDPMCGSGVIPIEASLAGGDAIGGDIDGEKIKIAEQNRNSKGAKSVFHVWDARKTGLKDKSIDKVVCNLPFGKQVTLPKDFFQEFIGEMARISREDSTWVFLTRQSETIIGFLSNHSLEVKQKIPVVNSGLDTEMLIIRRQ